MKKILFLTIMTLALFGNMQAQTQTLQAVTLSNNLHVYPEELGYFPAVPDSVIAAINQKISYGYDNWRVPTTKEMVLMKTNWTKIQGLTNDAYMTSDGQRSGKLRLVSTGRTSAKKELEGTGQKTTGGKTTNGKKTQETGQKSGRQKQQEARQKQEEQKRPPEEQKQKNQPQAASTTQKNGGAVQQNQQKTQLQAASTTQKSGGAVQQNQQKNPPHAASAKTWAFGSQTWSDAIRIPACDKESFEESYTNPQCCSDTEGGNTWYYYNWEYVSRNAATMCPAPWRVPTRTDMQTLMQATNASTLVNAWGYGGEVSDNTMFHVFSQANYWSSTETNSNIAYRLYYSSGNLNVANNNKRLGFQVRCVK